MPFNFAPTDVMTLGSVQYRQVGQFYQQPPPQFMNPPRTTPQFPQNLMRQSINGIYRARQVAFGALPDDVPVPLVSQNTSPQAYSSIPGVTSTATVSTAPIPLTAAPARDVSPVTIAVGGAVATASSLVSLYHGYKRNNSLGWGLWWGFMGAVFPLVTPTVALAQGYAHRRGR